MNRNALSAIAAFCVSLIAAASANAQGQKYTETICGVSVNGEIKAPPAGTNPSLARYLGVWTSGTWKDGVCNGLIVSEVTKAGAATVRFVMPATRDVPQGWFEKSDAALDSRGRLVFKSLLGSDLIYEMQNDGTMSGWLYVKDGSGRGILTGHTRKIAPPS